MERVILHSDLNCFYAAVNCFYNTEIRNKPVVVCGNPEERHGIILAKNEIAKGCGVKTGEAIWQAKQKCPNLVLTVPDYKRYQQFSEIAKDIYSDFTDQVEPFGLDECWLDISGSTGLFGDGKKVADEIRRRIQFELGITASVGVSYNKIFAKLGSDYKKPNATTVISKENFKTVAWDLPVSDLLYVGQATSKKLHSSGIYTIGQLASCDRKYLKYKLGVIGEMLWGFANGYDKSTVDLIGTAQPVKSIGNSVTAYRDLITDTDIKITLYALCESVSARLREHGMKCKTVQISIRDNELYSFERQGTVDICVNTTQEIFQKAYQLYQRNKTGRPIRSLGVRACKLTEHHYTQLSMLPDHKMIERHERLDCSIDTVRLMYGYYAVKRAVMLKDEKLNINAKGDHTIYPTAFLR